MPAGYRLVSGGDPEEFGDNFGVHWRRRFLACSRQLIPQSGSANPNHNPSSITALEEHYLAAARDLRNDDVRKLRPDSGKYPGKRTISDAFLHLIDSLLRAVFPQQLLDGGSRLNTVHSATDCTAE